MENKTKTKTSGLLMFMEAIKRSPYAYRSNVSPPKTRNLISSWEKARLLPCFKQFYIIQLMSANTLSILSLRGNGHSLDKTETLFLKDPKHTSHCTGFWTPLCWLKTCLLAWCRRENPFKQIEHRCLRPPSSPNTMYSSATKLSDSPELPREVKILSKETLCVYSNILM